MRTDRVKRRTVDDGGTAADGEVAQDSGKAVACSGRQLSSATRSSERKMLAEPVLTAATPSRTRLCGVGVLAAAPSGSRRSGRPR